MCDLSKLCAHGSCCTVFCCCQVPFDISHIIKDSILPGTHYGDVIMTTIASQITSLTIVYSIVYSDTDQRKYQSSASLAFVRGIHRGPVNSAHKWPVTRKMFPFDDVIMRGNHTTVPEPVKQSCRICVLTLDTNPRQTLRWRHNECDGVSNRQPHDCLLYRLFNHRSKKT